MASASSLRPDKRSPTDMREISIQFEGLHGVDGSARFGFGETKAIASVSGPIEVRLSQEHANRATFEVNVRPLAGSPGTESKSLASALRTALTPSLLLTHNPRSLIQLVVQSLTPVYSSLSVYSSPTTLSSSSSPSTSVPRLRTNPSLTAALINAATIALFNTGSFPMRGVVCAVGLGRLKSTTELILDPSLDEFAKLDGGGTFAFLLTHDPSQPHSDNSMSEELVWSNWMAYPFDESELVKAQEVARKAVREVWKCMKEVVADPQSRTLPRRTAKVDVVKDVKAEVDDDEMEI